MSLAKRVIPKACVLFTALAAVVGFTVAVNYKSIINSETVRTAMIKNRFQTNDARESQLKHLKSRREVLNRKLSQLSCGASTDATRAEFNQVFSEMNDTNLDISIIESLLAK